MGFNIGSAISGAISGAASGFMMGGPYGALAGGALGGAAGGFGVGGGPSSVGGITGGKVGGGAGIEAREYYDEAFPGTNPWERLGAGNPIGAIGSAAINAKAAQRNADLQAKTQSQNAMLQTSAAVKVAQINAAGAQAVATTHAGPAQTSADAASRAAGTGEARLPYEERRTVVAERQVDINKNLQRLKSMEVDIMSAKVAHDPATAALRAEAAKMFQAGLREKEIHEKLLKQYPALLGLGTAKEVGSFISNLLSGALGAKVRGHNVRPSMPKKSSVRPKPPDGGEKSAPSGYRPPGPDAATKKSRDYWMSR